VSGRGLGREKGATTGLEKGANRGRSEKVRKNVL